MSLVGPKGWYGRAATRLLVSAIDPTVSASRIGIVRHRRQTLWRHPLDELCGLRPSGSQAQRMTLRRIISGCPFRISKTVRRTV